MTTWVNPTTRIGGVDQIVVPERTTPGFDDAPYDDEQYVRINGEWVPVDTPDIIGDTLAPKPPTSLATSGVPSENGVTVDYTLMWVPPTQNVDGSPLTDLNYYVVRWHYAGGGPWASFVSEDASCFLPGLMPGIDIEWEVLARDTSGNDSTWASTSASGITDTVGPDQPSTPVLSTALGTITATWDGLDSGGDPPPPDFDHLNFYVSATSGGPWQYVDRVEGAGSAYITGAPVGSTRYVSTVAVDTSSNSSVRSSQASIVVAGVAGADIDAAVLAAISADSQAKADQAEADAIAAANTQAQILADQAEADAKAAAALDAQAKADQAEADAMAASAVTAQEMADAAEAQAHASATAAAAADATAKADAAQAAAINYASTMVISTTQIADDSISTPKLKANSVVSDKIAANAITAGKIAANSIRARELLLADTSNMAEINESFPVGAIWDSQHGIGAWGAGWSTRSLSSSTYFMFRDKAGPVPFKTGDRIRVTFEAYADAAVTGNLYLWMYGDTSTAEQVLPAIPITTAPTAFEREFVVATNTALKTEFMIGLMGLAGVNVYLRVVRAYVMNAGELIVDGTIKAKHIEAGAITTNELAAGAVDATKIKAGAVTTDKIAAGAVTADKVAAQSITAEKIALNAFSSNLIADPSFEEPYPFLPVASAQQHQWAIDGSSGAGVASRFGLPNSGLWALRMEKPAAAAYVRMRSGVFPVVPGKSYVVSMAIAKEFADTTALLYCRVAGGATAALTEKPATSLATAIPFVGDDPNTFESLDPPWIQENLYPGDLLTDGGAGVHAGAQAYNTGTTTTGVRSISGSGQVLSAASQAVSARWGTYIAFNVNQGDTYRLKLRWTGLAGTNARLRFYVDGQDVGGGGTTAHLVDNIVSAASGVTVLTPPTSAVYDTYKVYAWLEPAAGLTATSPTVTITSIEMERIDPDTGIVRPLLEMYNSLSATVTIPAGINFAAVKFVTSSGATANPQSIFVDDVSVVEVGRGGTEITAAGVRLFAGDGSEVGAFVSNRPNYLSVTRRGETLAGISQFGDVSGQTFTIAGKDTDGDGASDKGMEIYGTEFLDWLNQLGRGVVARGWRETSTASIGATEQPLLELQFDQVPGRQYVVHCAVPLYSTTVGTRAIIRIRGTTNGTTPGVTSTEYRGVRTAWALAGPTYWSFFHKMMGVKSGAVLDTRLLLTGDAETNTFSCPGSTTAPMEMWVEDLGPYMDDTGIDRTVTTPPVTKKTYTTTWTSTAGRCYMGNGAQDSSQGPQDMKHGYSSYDGNSKSLWIFNSMTSYLAGSTISKIRVYLYANHWYNNAGGTAYVKVHGYSSYPGSSPSMTTAVTSSNWPKPGGRWVTLPSSLHAGFISGAYKGIGVGPAPSNSTSYYGRFNRDGAKVEITYIK